MDGAPAHPPQSVPALARRRPHRRLRRLFPAGNGAPNEFIAANPSNGTTVESFYNALTGFLSRVLTFSTNSSNGSSLVEISDATYNSMTGVLTGQINNNPNGTSQEILFNPSPGVLKETLNFSGANATGTVTSQFSNLSGSASQITQIGNLPIDSTSQDILLNAGMGRSFLAVRPRRQS